MARKKLPDNPDDTKMSLGDHLDELRTRIIRALLGLVIAMGLTLWFGSDIIEILRYPFDQVLAEHPEIKGEIIVTRAPEAFMMYFRVCFMAGFVLASPWIFYQMWLFIAAGLYPHERRFVNYGAPFSAGLFILGAFFFLRFIAYPMMTFFIVFGYEFVGGVMPRLHLKEHIAMMTTMMIVFGLAFQMPIVVFIMGKMGLVTVKQLNHYRKHVVVSLLVLAAFATSPSPVDQVGLAVPMWLLYELGILLVYFFCKPKPFEEDDGGDYDDYGPHGTELATAGAGYGAGSYAGHTVDYDDAHAEHYENYYSNEYYSDEYYADEPRGAGDSADDYGESDYDENWDDNYDDDYDYDSAEEQGFGGDDDWSYEQDDADDDKPDVDYESESGYSWRPG